MFFTIIFICSDFRLTKKLQRSYKEFLFTLHPTSSNVNILYNNSTIIKIGMLTLMQLFKLPYQPYTNSTSCLISVILLVQDSHLVSSCYVTLFSFDLGPFPSLSWSFITLIPLRVPPSTLLCRTFVSFGLAYLMFPHD